MTPKTRALDLFEQLIASGSDLGAGVAALTARHPELQAEMAELYDRFCEIRDNLRFSPRSAMSLLRGSDDPIIDLEPPPGDDSEILRHLRDRRGQQNRYVLINEVGRGGMGTVLRVWDGELRRHLAMKVVRRSGRTQPQSSRLLRFLEEAQVTGQLEHPCIVPVHELGIDGEGNAFFTMRLVRGRELGEIIRLIHSGADGWSLTRGIGVLQRVAEAMAFAHAKGVVHRDLKPSNIMVGRFGEVYVMDWGAAKVLTQTGGADETPPIVEGPVTRVVTERGAADHTFDAQLITADGTVIGTPAFMAPEQAAGQVKDIGPRSDVYSMGAILYQLLCGSPPYVKPGQCIPPEVLAAMVLHGPPTDLHEMAPRAPAELLAICQKAMARSAEARYPSMLAMAEELRAWLEGRVVAAYETGALAELKKWMQRNRVIANAALLVILVVVLSLVVISWQKRQIATALEQSVQSRIIGLEQRTQNLWPETKATEPAIDTWIREVEALKGELTDDRLGDADKLLAPGGLLDQVKLRRQRAIAYEKRSLSDPEAIKLWQKARAAIADREQCPRYSGYQLSPQFGLLPLRHNKESGLWEFCHLLSGDEVKVGVDGKLVLTETSGIVLVLIPGNHNAKPFFLSKYEVTQGQWSRFDPRDSARSHHDGHGWRLPVDNVSWEDCVRVLGQLDLCLPTDLQWRRAAVTDASALLWIGPPVRLWRRFAVLSHGQQETPRDKEEQSSKAERRPQDVGSLRPNSFDLYDIYGNVWEWCAPAEATKLQDPRKVLQLGGSYDTRPEKATNGYEDFRDSRSKFVGVRPARVVKE